MATAFLSPAKTFFPSLLSSSSSSTPVRQNEIRLNSSSSTPILTKRGLAISLLTTTLTLPFFGEPLPRAYAAILEADDDEELLEKVKKDRKKRLERQGVINSSNKETAYLQDLVYKLSKVGLAIDNNDLSTASSVLGSSTNADWVQKVNTAFTKLTSSPQEKTQVDTFNSSLASLILSVTKNDIKSSKTAFLSSAIALEKWVALAGLAGQLKGL